MKKESVYVSVDIPDLCDIKVEKLIETLIEYVGIGARFDASYDEMYGYKFRIYYFREEKEEEAKIRVEQKIAREQAIKAKQRAEYKKLKALFEGKG